MGQQDHLASALRDFANGRRCPLYARSVANFSVLHRHVEVDAQEDAFVVQVGLIEGAESGHKNYCSIPAPEAPVTGEVGERSEPTPPRSGVLQGEVLSSNSYAQLAATSIRPSLNNKRVLLRVKVNSPWRTEKLATEHRTRRRAGLRENRNAEGKVVLLSHFGRPHGRDPKASLRAMVAGHCRSRRPCAWLL